MVFKIQIESVVTKSRFFIPWWNKNFITQAEIYNFGLILKNIGNEPVKSFTIKDINIRSVEGKNIIQTPDKTFFVDVINPSCNKKIWIDKLGTYITGLVNIEISFIPSNKTDIIETYQKDILTKQISKLDTPNYWEDFLYVISKAESSQDYSNKILVLFTILMVLLAFLNIYILISFQVQPKINEYKKNALEAKDYCKNNPNGEWPKTSGGTFKCYEILEMLK